AEVSLVFSLEPRLVTFVIELHCRSSDAETDRTARDSAADAGHADRATARGPAGQSAARGAASDARARRAAAAGRIAGPNPDRAPSARTERTIDAQSCDRSRGTGLNARPFVIA